MSNRIEPVKTTSEAAYNYSNAFRDAIHALNEAEHYLWKMVEEGNPDSLTGDKRDREWAKAKIQQLRPLIKQANFIKFGREGVTQA